MTIPIPISSSDRVDAISLDAPVPLAIGGRRITILAAVLAILALAATAVLLAATSHHVRYPAATALYYGYLVAVPLLVGLYWHVRRPSSSFWRLLVAFGISVWVVSWQSSNSPLVFSLGVLADGVGFVLTFWLFLAFPSGRLETPANRIVIAALTLTAAAFFLPWALLSPVIAGGGPLAACVPACPSNALQVGTNPDAVAFLGRWETYLVLSLALVTLGLYWRRVTQASRPMRRALLAVAGTSLLFLPAFFIFHFSRQILGADPGALEAPAWVLVGIRVLLPLGFAVALFQAELFAGAARGRLLEQLLERPSPAQWRNAVASALDDPPAKLGFWDPDRAHFRQADDSELTRPTEGSGRSWVTAERDGWPVAALVIDDALALDPELVRAATSATVLAVEHGALEGELRSSRALALEAGDAERRRIERDIHDSAQQRLVALRIHLGLTGERMDPGEQRAMIDRLGREVEDALEDLRSVTSGAYPPLLAEHGLAAALRSVAEHAALPVAVRDRTAGRHGADVEATVYFCCLEALQNAAKHAGTGASGTVRLDDGDGRIAFVVEDDGRGFDPDAVVRGQGLDNIADRLAAVGGTLLIDTAPGAGTRIAGHLPTRA